MRMPPRWLILATVIVPLVTAGMLFALAVARLDDLLAYVMEVGARSIPVLVGLSIAYGVFCILAWNIDNDERATLQRLVVAGRAQWRGAALVLAGEAFGFLALAGLVLWALLVAQG